MTPADETATRPVQRNPVPSLLRSLLTEHLDPGYADEARLRAEGQRGAPSRGGVLAWLVAGSLAIGVVFGVSAAHQSTRAPDTALVQQQIADDVRAQQALNDSLAEQRRDLAQQDADERTARLAGDAQGGEILGQLRAAEIAAAAVPISGPGMVVELAERPPRPDLSDKGRPGGNERGQVILDRDLQTVVNALWASGAKAIAIGGVRIGPAVSIRQAGGAILVDNQPVPSPYRVEAIGDASALQSAYIVSPAYLRLQSLQLYGVTSSITTAAELRLPEAPPRELRYAQAN